MKTNFCFPLWIPNPFLGVRRDPKNENIRRKTTTKATSFSNSEFEGSLLHRREENKEKNTFGKKKVEKEGKEDPRASRLDWQRPISQVRVRAASPRHIRHLTLRRRPEGPNVGRVWSARTVDYKTLKPYPGGLFCESVFGPIQKGICACGRTRRTQPKTVTRVCFHCGGTTSDPRPAALGFPPEPGRCSCGKTTTEALPGEPVFCGYCGTEITLDPRARRYRLGYLPLAAPLAHPWYYRGQPHYLAPLLGYSRRKLETLLKCEGGVSNGLQLRLGFQGLTLPPTDFAPAERLIPRDEPRNQRKSRRIRRRRLPRAPPPPRRTVKTISLTEHVVLSFPWYCLFRDALWRPSSTAPRLENRGRDLEGLGRLTSYLVTEPRRGDRLLPRYGKLPNLLQRRPLSDHAPRTGGDLLLERLQSLDPIGWVTHARAGLLDLDEKIEDFEQGSLRKNEVVEYRRLLRQRGRLLRRLRIRAELRISNVQPSWLRLQCLPILPADLRPAIPRGEGLVRVSDVNKLYQRVVSRNLLVAEIRRETTVQENSSYRGDLRYAQRLLQEGVDALIENGRGGAKPERDARGRRLKSLSETLKGKRGRFRRNLLGKRVDYSGRSVIVSGPELALHQCGLPRERALTLLQPFLLRHLLGRSIQGERRTNRLRARKRLEEPTEAVWAEIVRAASSLPVLLNRAPTLHRLGFQAFQPKIISGRAILLHPLACSGFNADFDGDQRAVHIPLSTRARAEAWRLRTPGAHFFSPATGEPGFLPSQDRVLGCYYLTTGNALRLEKWAKKEPVFPNLTSFRTTYERGHLAPHRSIWRASMAHLGRETRKQNLETEEGERVPQELRIDPQGNVRQVGWNHVLSSSWNGLSQSYIRTTAGRALRADVLQHAIKVGSWAQTKETF